MPRLLLASLVIIAVQFFAAPPLPAFADACQNNCNARAMKQAQRANCVRICRAGKRH